MARKFLYTIAFLTILFVAGVLVLRLFSAQLTRFVFVPSAAFVEQKPLAPNAWASKSMWYARPDLPGNPALWTPSGFKSEGKTGTAAIFFIHPTSYLDGSSWNAPLDNAEANTRAELFIRGQASAFNGVGQIWAPRYRQATFGSFLTTKGEAQQALDAAYLDVLSAWDAFIAANPGDTPIIIAGHSQGALHLMRLMRERVAGQPISQRIVAAYVIGWPVSVTADLPAMGLPACAKAEQAQCVLSWQSFAEPADPSQIIEVFDRTKGPTGIARAGTRMLCTNPLTGVPDRAAPASANHGAIVPSSDLKTGVLTPNLVPARCDSASGGRGFLLIGPPPEGIGTYVLPGNNYHVFDYSLFWSDVRSDAARRLATFEKR